MIITYVCLLASVILNILLLILYKNKVSNKKLAVDARQLLHDLTHGGSIVRISVVDPEGLLIYRGAEK